MILEPRSSVILIFKPDKVSTRKESFRKVNLVSELTVFCEETEFCGKMWVREGGHKKFKKKNVLCNKSRSKKNNDFYPSKKEMHPGKKKKEERESNSSRLE